MATYFKSIIVAATALAISACGSGDNASLPQGTLATVGNEALTRDDLRRNMPVGLSPSDSTTLARAYIRAWIDARLIEKVAVDEVDMAEVERLTNDYRSQLIMAQYRKAMAQQIDGEFGDDSLKAYYDTHTADFILERPLIKGIYLKVPEDAQNLATLRKLYRSQKPIDMDKLEKAAIGSAIHYDYFRDEWVDWEQIENRIPLDFTRAHQADLAAHKPIDAKVQGFVYLLSVSDYLPAGNAMPFETARPLIRERLLAQKRRAYDKKLLNDLYDRSLENGTLTYPAGNPLQ